MQMTLVELKMARRKIQFDYEEARRETEKALKKERSLQFQYENLTVQYFTRQYLHVGVVWGKTVVLIHDKKKDKNIRYLASGVTFDGSLTGRRETPSGKWREESAVLRGVTPQNVDIE